MSQEIKFGANKPATIFSDIAEYHAQKIKSSKEANKTTQLRKFYDELSMWNERVQQAPNKAEKYQELEPFIKMLKAKVAYAKGRKHINDDFRNVFDEIINQINNVETLRDAKLFFEAVIGYCKLYEAK
ncbi:type III-A CRISPR-associated protein Csm2 [Gallibacterium genomosp. 3]|uniref:CRISPR system Cms protein Csm2 n=1 Tax=Gallibacterium genomosp. 3 TaxID=505345 RepID=A0A1A7Q623_9PAST|nr:type III-A CRISPR-associated protein Csm2 [Gallibacterium genomosp. 3]OBX09342.1 CRISPR-associated protein Csm2 [Gallibacterium genomosp. 3]